MQERVVPQPRARPSLGPLLEPFLARLRARIRRQELALVALAALIGLVAGLVVTALRQAAQLLHVLLFALPAATRLSASVGVATWRVLLVPTLGGLVVGGLLWLFQRGRKRPAVDPIEANALYGGRMSLSDSAWIGLQTLASTGSGASVGLEAGYTQVCAALGVEPRRPAAAAAQRPAAPGRLRSGRRDRRRLQRPLDRRLLRLRAGDRQLHPSPPWPRSSPARSSP